MQLLHPWSSPRVPYSHWLATKILWHLHPLNIGENNGLLPAWGGKGWSLEQAGQGGSMTYESGSVFRGPLLSPRTYMGWEVHGWEFILAPTGQLATLGHRR